MHKLSRLSWAEIQNAPRHGLGFEKITQSQIRLTLPTHLTEEVSLLVFRYFGMKAMVGYRNKDTYYILALDRDFTLYEH